MNVMPFYLLFMVYKRNKVRALLDFNYLCSIKKWYHGIYYSELNCGTLLCGDEAVGTHPTLVCKQQEPLLLLFTHKSNPWLGCSRLSTNFCTLAFARAKAKVG